MRSLMLLPTALALMLSACGSEEGPTSAEKTEWAESQCSAQGADEYSNPEGWDRCMDDFLPKAEEGIAAEKADEAKAKKNMEDFQDLKAKTAAATAKYADDPRCLLYDGSGREEDCIEDFGLDPSAENFVEPVDVTGETSGMPACTDVWKVGETLPADYEGCVDGDEFYAPSKSVCQDKGDDGLEPVGDMIVWSTPEQSFYAKSLYDYEILDADRIYRSEYPSLPVIYWESMTCSVSGESDWYRTEG